MMRITGYLALVCVTLSWGGIGVIGAQAQTTDAVAEVQVLQDDEPLAHVQVVFSRLMSGTVDADAWAAITDAAGRAEIRIGSGSGYYLARVLSGEEIGRWHSLPLNRGQRTAFVLRVGKRFELYDEPGGALIPEAPAMLRISDYEGGDETRYLMSVWPHTTDRAALSNYRLYRELPDDVGGIVQLTFVPYMAADPVFDGSDSVRVVFPVLDALITRWAVAAERIGSNGVISSALTIADSPVRPVDTEPPAPVTDVFIHWESDRFRVTWTPSVDDVVLDGIVFRGTVFPIVGVRAYEVYRRYLSGEWVMVAQLPRGASEYVDLDSPPWQIYSDNNSVSYRVDALDFDNRTPSDELMLVFVSKPARPDIEVFHRAFGAYLGDAAYVPEMDFNGDGVVDFADFLFWVQKLERE